MTRRVALIDLGVGNLFNVESALQALGLSVVRVSRAGDLPAADAIVFPGVAHFGFVAQALRSTRLDAALRSAIAGGTPYLGICAGMQILFEGSDEAPGAAGLAVLQGTVQRLQGPKSPHIGWNEVRWSGSGAHERDGWAFFAHAYAPLPGAEGVTATAVYGAPFAAACERANVTGFQFHPERSGGYGRSLLERSFVREAVDNAR